LELKEKNTKIDKLQEAIRSNQPVQDSGQTDERVMELRKEQMRDKEKIRQQDERILTLSRELEIANQFKDSLKDKDPTQKVAELINTNEELAKRLQKMNKELTEYKEKVGDLNRQKIDYETEMKILKEKLNLPEDWGIDYRQARNREKSDLEWNKEQVNMLKQTNIVLEKKNKELEQKIMNQYQSYTGKGAKFNLSPLQMMLVDEYAENLRNGIDVKPEKS